MYNLTLNSFSVRIPNITRSFLTSQFKLLTTANVDQNCANSDLKRPKFSATPAILVKASVV